MPLDPARPPRPAIEPRFDLDLFLALNEEYRDHPVVPKPRSFDAASLTSEADRRARNIDAKVPLRGKRVLEVGCGRGQLGSVLRSDYDADYVGLDIVAYDEWDGQRRDGVEFVAHDLSDGDSSHLGSFDVIVSLAVLEHVVHPYAMLQAIYQRLKPGGIAYLGANLYRGPIASHCYRQVFFPWPHLLFGDDVWREFYWQEHGRDKTYSWVNKLTYAQYLLYFDQIGFEQKRVWRSLARFDKPFYERFSDQLSRYPIFDLSYDFVYAILERPLSAVTTTTASASKRELALERDLAAMRSSLSWRVTKPLRRVSRHARHLLTRPGD